MAFLVCARVLFASLKFEPLTNFSYSQQLISVANHHFLLSSLPHIPYRTPLHSIVPFFHNKQTNLTKNTMQLEFVYLLKSNLISVLVYFSGMYYLLLYF